MCVWLRSACATAALKVARRVGRHQFSLRVALVNVGPAGAERVRHLAEGCLNGELVLRDGHTLFDVRQVEICAVLTSSEDR